MTDVQTTEGSFTTPDGFKLYTNTWSPIGDLKARLVFIHGFSDHCNFQGVLPTTFAQHGIKMYSYDQRGWGRSVAKTSQRGLTGPTTLVLDDITAFINNLPKEEDGVPLFLMGHSMGGAEVIMYASNGPQEVVSKITGFLVESPFIALTPEARPWKITVILGRLAGRLLPSQHMVQKLDPSRMCRDPALCQEWVDDPLCHDTGTLEGLAGMLDRAGSIEGGDVVLREGRGKGGKTRLMVAHGSADGICDYNACKKWFDGVKAEDKEFKGYEGWYHKLHCEPDDDKHQFSKDMASWILDRSRPASSSSESRSKL